jgi:hypothetical protein
VVTEEVKPPMNLKWGIQYRVEPDIDNYPFHPLFLSPDDHTQRFVQQRMRLWLSANPADNVEGYIQVQMGGILWGQDRDFGKITVLSDGDHFGISLRRGWVAYTDPDCGKVRVGILDWHDSFGDTLASSDYDFNIGGIEWSKTFKEWENLRMVAGAFLLSDLALVTSDPSPLGSHTALLFTYDIDQPLDEKTSLGASAYAITDQGDYSYASFPPYKSSYDVWLGVRGKTELGCVPVNGFFVFNFGDRTDGVGTVVFKHAGYMGKLECGPIPIGPGKWSTQVLCSSGGDQNGESNTAEFRTVAQTYGDNFGAQGYWSYLQLTSPNAPSDVSDLGVSMQNQGLGLFTIQTKYEYPICGKLSGTSAAGYLRSMVANPINGSMNMGTELAQMFTYNFGHGLTLDFGAAVLFTGNFYRPSPTADTPRDLYEVFSRLQLEF